jgi:hypothetical protein
LHLFERRSAGLAKLAVAAAEEFCATQPESGDPRRARRHIPQIGVEQCHGGRDLGDKPAAQSKDLSSAAAMAGLRAPKVFGTRDADDLTLEWLI